MFNKILVANRGEIACRVIKTANLMGIKTVAVFSEVDADALHVKMADEGVNIGPAPATESYLNINQVIQAAMVCNADAIHPGYGFLSENAAFAQACEQNNLTFIGPSASAIEKMGSKSAAKQIMATAEVPLIPGYHGEDQQPDVLHQQASEVGYPVLLKAAAGGGGKGMRLVWQEPDFEAALAAAIRESLNAFNDDKMLVEKYLVEPRHVEVQIFCDQANNAVYLSDRDCSIQRRHQKIIEEAPAPGISPALRKQMGEAAIRCAQAINYVGAGTVEFLLDRENKYYFMEMNTRLQVEHPVTEMITGIDLVEWQIRIAAGEPLPLLQKEITSQGHAIEARIYAEDPDNNFLPQTGTLTYLSPPLTGPHVRIDTGVMQGDKVDVFYDPMIAKLVSWDEDRSRALQRLDHALADYHISGITTNIKLLHKIAGHSAFGLAEINTGFIEQHEDDLLQPESTTDESLVCAMAFYLVQERMNKANKQASESGDPHSPWHHNHGWRLNEPHRHPLQLAIGAEQLSVEVEFQRSDEPYIIRLPSRSFKVAGSLRNQTVTMTLDERQSRYTIVESQNGYTLFSSSGTYHFQLVEPDYGTGDTHADTGGLNAPMNGIIVSLLVETGQPVDKGEALMVMEAMKMEHTIHAPSAGSVSQFNCSPGDRVDGGIKLIDFDTAS